MNLGIKIIKIAMHGFKLQNRIKEVKLISWKMTICENNREERDLPFLLYWFVGMILGDMKENHRLNNQHEKVVPADRSRGWHGKCFRRYPPYFPKLGTQTYFLEKSTVGVTHPSHPLGCLFC